MAITAASLADGQLPNSATALYTVPASTAAHVHITVANTSSSTAYTFNLYIKRSGGTSRRIVGKDKAIAASADVESPSSALAYKLSAGDAIWGDASTANVIDYMIVGGTEPV